MVVRSRGRDRGAVVVVFCCGRATTTKIVVAVGACRDEIRVVRAISAIAAEDMHLVAKQRWLLEDLGKYDCCS